MSTFISPKTDYGLRTMLTSSSMCVLLAVLLPSGEPLQQTTFCSGSALEVDISTFNLSKIHFDHELQGLEIPGIFDSREKWPFCPNIQKVSDQKKCGGCWAYAASSVITDRFCIGMKGDFTFDVSTQDLLECCVSCIGPKEKDEGGCGDGYTVRAFEFWKQRGLVSGNEACKPISLETEMGVPPKLCRNNSCPNLFYKGNYLRSKSWGLNFYVHVEAFKQDLRLVQAEIMLNGPITATMDMYKSMYEITGPTILRYTPKMKKEKKKPHAVKIVGWNVIDDIPVWIISNSLGRLWCNHGFCYVRRGKNDFNIESYIMVTGTPKLSHISRVNDMRRLPSTSGCQTHPLLLSTFMIYLVTYCIAIRTH